MFYKEKMKKQKVLKVLGAAALVGLTTLTMTSCSLTDWIGGIIHPTEKPETPTPDEDNKQDSGNVIVDGKELGKDETVDHMPQAIAFRRASNDVSAQSAQGATVTFNATVEPDYAVDKNVTWSLAWNGSNSGNVNDYVSLNITNETHTVTVTCKKVFNTQINLTAKTSGGQTATATLDVLKELSAIKFAASYYENGGDAENPYPTNFDESILINSKQVTYIDEDNRFGDINFAENTNAYDGENYNGDSKEIYFGFAYEDADISGTVGTITSEIKYTLTDGFKTFLSSNNEYKELLTYYKEYNDDGLHHYNFNQQVDYTWAYSYGWCEVPCFSDLLGELTNVNKDSNKIKLIYQLKTAMNKYYQANYQNNSDGGKVIQANIKIINTYNSQTYTLANVTAFFSPSICYRFTTTGISISSSSGVFTQA